jgi:histidinol dehydrogenase
VPMQLIQDLEAFDWTQVIDRDPAPNPEILSKVQGILHRVKHEGRSAVEEMARQFDQLQGSLRLSESTIAESAAHCPAEVRAAIQQAIQNVRDFHSRQVENSWRFETSQGSILGQTLRPLGRVGLYVPGGAGSYPSTVIMNAVPAQVAGVKSIAVVTPCAQGLNPAVACALQELGLTEVYAIGGAQAVGMLAYGIEGVPRVDKIVGPANVWAALAKREVFGIVDIDMIAGPSEILVYFDDSVSADWIAADLLSQAEHGSGYEAAIGVTTSLEAAQKVQAAVQAQV